MALRSRRADTVEALQELLAAHVALMHRLTFAAQQLHQEGELSAGRRGVLLSLHNQGPRTVPQLARMRPVSRQHMQTHVNSLAGDGYVELVDNPAHRRSRLVRLTAQGEQALEQMRQREAAAFAQLRFAFSASQLRAASAVVRGLREALTGPPWALLAESLRPPGGSRRSGSPRADAATPRARRFDARRPAARRPRARAARRRKSGRKSRDNAGRS
jgi:DNA-binding MarR family transcriptional regulator